MMKSECAKCETKVCRVGQRDKGPENCPVKIKDRVIEEASARYEDPEVRRFALTASIQEFECYMKLPQGSTMMKPRVQETIEFAKKMGYRRLGLAFCVGLSKEADLMNELLEANGFEVVSVCCKVGAVSKEAIGVKEEQKIAGPGKWETMCNPITQAYILNDMETEFNIAVGLCVGHDSLFLKHAKALTTVLIAKDRVLGHNPAAALYLLDSYYKRLKATPQRQP